MYRNLINNNSKTNKMKTFSENLKDIEAKKIKAMNFLRIRDNESGVEFPVAMTEWANNGMFIDAPEGKYTSLGKWDETKK